MYIGLLNWLFHVMYTCTLCNNFMLRARGVDLGNVYKKKKKPAHDNENKKWHARHCAFASTALHNTLKLR